MTSSQSTISTRLLDDPQNYRVIDIFWKVDKEKCDVMTAISFMCGANPSFESRELGSIQRWLKRDPNDALSVECCDFVLLNLTQMTQSKKKTQSFSIEFSEIYTHWLRLADPWTWWREMWDVCSGRYRLWTFWIESESSHVSDRSNRKNPPSN